jgi:hypothetical protein
MKTRHPTKSLSAVLLLSRVLGVFAFGCCSAAAAVDLAAPWDDGQYWIPRTYTDHLPSGQEYAVDFFWIEPQAGNQPRSATQHADDGYDAAAEAGRGKNVRAAHAGIAQFVNYTFSPTACPPHGAEAEIRVSAGSLSTTCIHMETVDPIQINDAVTVYNREAGSLNLRSSATTSAGVVSELPDGTRMIVIGGPVEADGFRWWELRGVAATGWAVEKIGVRKTLHNCFIHRSTVVTVVSSLNLRPTFSTTAAPLATLAPGTEMTVVGGPELAEGYVWWQLQGAEGTGWAVDAIPSASGEDAPTLGRAVSAGGVIGFVSDQGCADRPHLMFFVNNGGLQRLHEGSVLLDGEVILSGPSRTDGYNTVYNSMPRTAQPPIGVTVASVPSGLQVTVDGVGYLTPQLLT